MLEVLLQKMAQLRKDTKSTAQYESTVVVFHRNRTILDRTKGKRRNQDMCEELKTLKREAVHVLRKVKGIRRSRDLSFYEDALLNCEKHDSINAVLKHLLVGHEGKPCPAGDRPIVGLTPSSRDRR
jgi:hypothetical protein